MSTRSTVGIAEGFVLEYDVDTSIVDWPERLLLTLKKGFFENVESCADYLEIEISPDSEFAKMMFEYFKTAKNG